MNDSTPTDDKEDGEGDDEDCSDEDDGNDDCINCITVDRDNVDRDDNDDCDSNDDELDEDDEDDSDGQDDGMLEETKWTGGRTGLEIGWEVMGENNDRKIQLPTPLFIDKTLVPSLLHFNYQSTTIFFRSSTTSDHHITPFNYFITCHLPTFTSTTDNQILIIWFNIY